MKKDPSVLRHYQLIAGLSSQMLASAEAQDWDEVVKLGKRYYEAVQALRALGTLSNEDRAARRELLTRILGNDERIRTLAAPELARLGHLLGAIKRQQTVLQAYHSTTPEP